MAGMPGVGEDRSRFSSLRAEFWRLHAEQGEYRGADSLVHAQATRGPSVELPLQDKLDLVGFMNQSHAANSASRHAGSLPLSRLGPTPSVMVTASANWISDGSHLVKHQPSFKAFCEQQQQRLTESGAQVDEDKSQTDKTD